MRESHAESSRGQPSNDYKALKTSNDLSESTIEGIKYALVVLSRSHREGLGIVRSNRQFRETFQLLPDVKPGTPLTEALPNSGLEAIVEQGMTSGEAIREVEFSYSVASDSSSRRHRQGRGDSEERHFLLAISKINAPSSCRGVLVTFDEITEWKRRQFQVMEASRLVSIGEMAAGVAHEINNPLAAVMGFAQLVLRRDVDSSVQRDVERVLAEAKRASKIIANLQSFARRYKPKKDPVVMSRVLQKVLDFRAYELQVNNIEVINKFDSDTPRVMGDKHQLEQVILNIVTNAEQFMFEANGGGRLTVEIGKIKSKVRVSIGDDGPGIERKNLPKIFDPFFTTKEVGRGSGLGLSVCYGIVHEHDGIIRVDSSPGQGATFIIDLPAAQESSSVSGTLEVSDSGRSLGPMNILVVDDEPAIVEFVSRALSEYGHTVHVARGGGEAIEMQGLTAYDLIILDMKMPGVGGATLFEHIRGLSEEMSSKILFITGDTTNPVTGDFINNTGNPVLTKPFALEDLISAVRQFSIRRGFDGTP